MEEAFEEQERNFDAKYEVSHSVGEGAYGKVYKGRCTSTGRLVALKKDKLSSEEEGVPYTTIREIALLKTLSHPHVVELLDMFCSPRRLIVVFEFLPTDLKKYMRSRGCQLEPPTVQSLSFQLCRGIEFCHANSILHRDLKPSNLLVDSIDSLPRLKIADFGIARAYALQTRKYSHEVGTVWYRPLEILLGSQLYSHPVDMWGVGCILAEMATGMPLFGGDSAIGTIFKIFQKLGTPTTEQWPGLSDLPDFKPTFPKWEAKGWENIRNTTAQVGQVGIDLLEQLMVYDPERRLSARRALMHPYFVDTILPEFSELGA